MMLDTEGCYERVSASLARKSLEGFGGAAKGERRQVCGYPANTKQATRPWLDAAEEFGEPITRAQRPAPRG